MATQVASVRESEDDEEALRIELLRSYNILDTAPEIAFDRIVDLAQTLFETPIALVTLVDRERQWFKAKVGVTIDETPREQAFCDYAIRQPGVMVVPDARLDERFADNPFVTAGPCIRFYAGAPLITPSGARLGTVCVISPEPRSTLDSRDLRRLATLAGIAANEMELRLQTAHARRHAFESALLTEEIDHRVEGSLHLVSCALEAKAIRSSDLSTRRALYEAIDRIGGARTLHQHLRGSTDPFGNDATAYLLALINTLQEAVVDEQGGQTIALTVDESLVLPVDRLLRLGMVVTELVANALSSRCGKVVVVVRCDGDETVVSITGEGGLGHRAVALQRRSGLAMLSKLAQPSGVAIDPSFPYHVTVRLVAT